MKFKLNISNPEKPVAYGKFLIPTIVIDNSWKASDGFQGLNIDLLFWNFDLHIKIRK